MDPLEEFDHLVIFDPNSPILEGKCAIREENFLTKIQPLVSLLIEGFRERLCSIKTIFIALKSKDSLPALGLRLNSELATSALIRGPSSESDDGKKFREFWANKSELRHVDGDLYECVIWDSSNNITLQIIDFLFARYFSPIVGVKNQPWHQVTSTCLNGLLSSFAPSKLKPDFAPRANSLHLIRTVDRLYTIMQELNTNLPLNVIGVQSVSSEFRDTAVFAPILTSPKKSTTLLDHTLDPIYVIINIETSGKWPRDDLVAFLHMKRLFLFRIKELLTPKGIPSRVVDTGMLDIFLNGLVLRVSFYQPLEHLLLKLNLGVVVKPKRIRPKKVVSSSSKFSIQRTADDLSDWLCFNEHLPAIASQLNTISRAHIHAFPIACRLAKRWLSAKGLPVVRYPDPCSEPRGLTEPYCRHALGDSTISTPNRLNEIAVELMIVYAGCFTPRVNSEASRGTWSSQDVSPSSSPLATFLRFLKLLASYDWIRKPLVVDLNEGFVEKNGSEKVQLALQAFSATPRENLSPVVIISPLDTVGTLWTQSGPSLGGLKNLQNLARSSHDLLRAMLVAGARLSDLKGIFRPDMSEMDILLRLKPSVFATRLFESVDIEVDNRFASRATGKTNSAIQAFGKLTKEPDSVALDLPYPGGSFWPKGYLYDPLTWFLSQIKSKVGDNLFSILWDRHSARWVGLKVENPSLLSDLLPFKAQNLVGFSRHYDAGISGGGGGGGGGDMSSGELAAAVDSRSLFEMLRLWSSEFVDSFVNNVKSDERKIVNDFQFVYTHRRKSKSGAAKLGEMTPRKKRK